MQNRRKQWREPRHDSAASVTYWRGRMAALLCVEPSYLDEWEIGEFMRWVSAARSRVVAPPEPQKPAT